MTESIIISLSKLPGVRVINYEENPRWDKPVLEATGGEGADTVVETGAIQRCINR